MKQIKKNKILLIQPPVKDFYLTKKRTIPYGLISLASSLKKAGFDVELFDSLSTSKSKIIKLPENMKYLDTFYGREDMSPFGLFHKFRYFGYSFQHMEKTIRESKADLIGISSLFTAYCQEAFETAKLVKKILPESIIVIGGHHPTEFPEQVLSKPYIDYVIRGEGERAFTNLASNLSNNLSVKNIQGLSYKKKTEV